MANRNSQAIQLNFKICGISLAILFTNEHCLINTAILRRKHMTFSVSPSKYSSTLNKKIRQKVLFHSYRSVS